MSEKATQEQLLASTARWTAAVRARESLCFVTARKEEPGREA